MDRETASRPAPTAGVSAPRSGPDRGALLAGALLTAVVALAWTALVWPPTGRLMATSSSDRSDSVVASDHAGPSAPPWAPASAIARGELGDDFWNELRVLGDAVGTRPGPDAPDPAVGGIRASSSGRETLRTATIDAGTAAAEEALLHPPPSTWSQAARSTPLAAIGGTAPPALALASFLGTWELLVLAVVLPGVVPVLAAYGAARRTTFDDRRPLLHALLFALPALGLWLLTGVLVRAAVLVAAAAGPTPIALTPNTLAIGIGAVALHRLSPLHEGALRASRRSAPLWARRAAPGYRGTLAVGWRHGIASLGVGAGLVVLLDLSGATLPWVLSVALLLFAERALPRGDRTARVAGGMLVALTFLAVAWPASALAVLQGARLRAPETPREVVAARVAAAPDLRLLHTIAAQVEPIADAAFAPDGEHLATTSGAGVQLWRVSTGRREGVLAPRTSGSGSPAVVLAYSRRGNTIAAGRRDGAVSLWDTGSGRELLVVPTAGSPVTGLALSPDGRAMIVARADGVLALLDPPTARPALTFGVSGLLPPHVAFSPAGDLLAWSDSDGTLRLRGVGPSGAVRILGQMRPASRIVFSPDGTTLAVGGHHAVDLWDATTSEARRTLQHPSAVGDLAFSADGAALTAVGDDGTVTTWQVATGRELRTARVPGPTTATLAVSSTALVVATASQRNGRYVVQLWGEGGGR